MSQFGRSPFGGGYSMAGPPVTPMLRRLLIALGVAFAVQTFIELFLRSSYGPGGESLISLWLGVWSPLLFRGALWQLLTYGFLHGGIFHLLMNMLGLWMFGGEVERMLGSRRFLYFFLACVAGGGVLHAVLNAWMGQAVPVIGASAGVIGVVMAFILFNPNRMIMLLIPPIPMRAKTLGWIYLALDLYGAMTSHINNSAVSNFAHLGGMAVAFIYIKFFFGPGGWGGVRFRFTRRKRYTVVRDDDRGPFTFH